MELIRIEQIKIVSNEESETKNVLKFFNKNRYFVQTFNKDRGCGFKFIEEFEAEHTLLNSHFHKGKQISKVFR